ncbi:hypothetical protein BJ166DRAFT_222497 [Pestalotiopsis sp. NC0098]|nr:hypothetical protein BJ166DRAFT_222497 [Pestalotiopsis sp. NC0098]
MRGGHRPTVQGRTVFVFIFCFYLHMIPHLVFGYAVTRGRRVVSSKQNSPAKVLLRHRWDGVLQPSRGRRQCFRAIVGVPARGLAFTRSLSFKKMILY